MINPEQPDFNNTPISTQRPSYNYACTLPFVPPAVSIVTPFYNVAPQIFKETIQCLLKQSFQQWEWLIVNDGSNKPETLVQLTTLSQEDTRVKIINCPENYGPSAARNRGLQVAQAEFILLLDSDDLLEPTSIEKWLWFLFTRPDVGFTRGFSVRFGHSPHLWKRSFEQAHLFLGKNQIETTSMIRRGIWRQVGGFDEEMREGLEDWDFWLKCATHGFWGKTVPEYLNWYRIRSHHEARWPAFKNNSAMLSVREQLKQRYLELFKGRQTFNWEDIIYPPLIPLEQPCSNRLFKPIGHLRGLLIADTLTAKLQTNIIQPLAKTTNSLSVCTTALSQPKNLAQVSHITPDVFVLPNFLHTYDYPRFLCYLIASRQFDVVIIYESRIGYDLLPFLQTNFPQVLFIDYVEENSAYAVYSKRYQPWLSQVAGEFDWENLLSQLKPVSTKPLIPKNTASLLSTLAVEHYTDRYPTATGTATNNVLHQFKDLSGEDVASVVSLQKLAKAFVFKLGNQRGFRWLYRFRNVAKRLTRDH